MTKTDTSTTQPRKMTEEQLEQQFDQLQAEWAEVSEQYDELNQRLRELGNRKSALGEKLAAIANEQARRTIPFQKGDIVVDDQGVRYRVHDVHLRNTRYHDYSGSFRTLDAKTGTVFGIRLTKNGNEAYARPREIVSSTPLTKE